ncbi:MAG: RagB/SusD family nutrient uptake outer membrane protein [Candidatus Cyclobacteriaceae bacterium M2_1C_046]
MKKLYIIILTAFITFACDEELDLRPPQAIDEDVALSTDSNVKATLMGAYDAIGGYYLLGGVNQMHAELLGADGEFQFSGTYGSPSEIWRKEITTINGDVANLWLNYYEAINTVNNVLSALDVVNEADRDFVEGEALFIRGLAYFELVKLYAQPYSAGNVNSNPGVPLVLTPTRNITEENYVARATVQQVYDQVIADLSTAEQQLSADNGVFANSVAAAGILSRVYLQMENFEAARDAANRAIQTAQGIYDLAGDVEAAFNNETNSIEDIFAIQVTVQDGYNAIHLFFASTLENGRGDIEIFQEHLDLYEPGDERGELFYEDGATGDIRTAKYINQFANVPFLRLTELYLTRAEANFRLGTEVGATPAEDVNRIRTRAGLIEIPALLLTLDDILTERKLELAFEGQKIHDIKRLRQSADGFAFDAPELVFPIPQREMDVNSSLVQNNGYN